MNNNAQHILIISTTYIPFIGGAEIAIDEITKRIPSHDAVFHMITLRFDKSLPRYEQINNVHIYRIGWGTRNPKVSESLPLFLGLQKILFPIIALPTALSLIVKKKIQTYWLMLMNTTTLIWYFLPKKKTILSLQDGRTIAELFSSKLLKLLKPLFMYILKHVDHVQGISQFIVRDVATYRQQNTVMIPNGVDIEKFTQVVSIETIGRIRSEYGFLPNDNIIITVSRLVPSRGVEDSILALNYLPEHYKLVIVGDGHLKKHLEQLVQQNNFSGRVVFVGMKSHDELIPIMKSCDVFVRVSQYEGMGNAFIEAMAAELPVVGTVVGGIVDFLKPGETGFFCESGKPETVAQAIMKYEDDTLKNQIIDTAKKYIQEKYSWDMIAREMNNLLTK